MDLGPPCPCTAHRCSTHPCMPVSLSFSLSLSVHSRTRGSGVEGTNETWSCGARVMVGMLEAKEGMKPNLPGVWEDMLPLSQA